MSIVRSEKSVPALVFALALVITATAAIYIAYGLDGLDTVGALVLAIGTTASCALYWIAQAGVHRRAAQAAELERAGQALARHGERLRILHEIDRAIAAEETPEAITGAVVRPLRELLGVARAIVNIFHLETGEVEWLAAAGRRRVHIGPGVRYSLRLMGDVEALKRGEPQLIDTHALPPGPDVDALLASGVHSYMAVPMIAGGELIGAISFGGAQALFPEEQVNIAREVATQLAIAIVQARLLDRVRRHAQDLEQRVQERTRALAEAHARLQETNAELLQLTARVTGANKELEAFSYSISHDLRAPLRAIAGYAKILEEDHGAQLDPEGRHLLTVVRDNSAQMSALIDALLLLARFGNQAMVSQEQDMTALARKVCDEIVQATAGGPAIEFELRPLPPAWGDATLLRQVWRNLIGNAAKYSGKSPAPRIEISGHVENGVAVYCVKDNGAGFDMRHQGKLFGVFQRLHGDAEFSGTGIGLAIVQRVVNRHGGKAWAEGMPGLGASFYFSLPARGAEQAPRLRPVEAAG